MDASEGSSGYRSADTDSLFSLPVPEEDGEDGEAALSVRSEISLAS